MEYDLYKIEESGRWNSTEKEIRKLSSQLFKDEYKTQKAKGGDAIMPTKEEIDEFGKMLTKKMRAFKDEWKRLVKEGHEILKDIKEDDLKGKSKSVLNYFYKGKPEFKAPSEGLKNSRPEQWLQKTCNDAKTIAAIEAIVISRYSENTLPLNIPNKPSKITSYPATEYATTKI